MFGLSKRMLIVIGVLVLVVVLYAVQNSRNSTAQQQQSTGPCQMQVTADVLNVRSGAADSAPVVGKLTSGKVTPASKTVQNGYRELGANRWVSNQFVKAVSGAC